MDIITRTGNLFKHLPTDHAVMLPHICNDARKWGAGFTKPLTERFPAARDAFFDTKQSTLGTVLFSTTDNVTVADMIAQHGVRSVGNLKPIDYGALSKCMASVVVRCRELKIREIHCPRFGTGLAGGDWSVICALIEEHWCALKVIAYSFT